MKLRSILMIVIAIVAVTVPAASAQWADPTELRSAGREDTSVPTPPQTSPAVKATPLAAAQETTVAAQVEVEQEAPAGRLVSDDRPPVPPVPSPARPTVPAPPTGLGRSSTPSLPALTLKPSPTYNYQGCEIKLNVTGAPNGTLVTFNVLFMDFGAFSDDGTFKTPQYQEVAHATVTNGVATIRVRNTSPSSLLFQATSSVGKSNEYPVGWIQQTSPSSPCLPT